jgi:hypothetical protein
LAHSGSKRTAHFAAHLDQSDCTVGLLISDQRFFGSLPGVSKMSIEVYFPGSALGVRRQAFLLLDGEF